MTTKAHIDLIRYAIKKGFVVSVFDGEEWVVRRSTAKREIYAAIDSVGESQLAFRDKAGNKIGWALIIDQGQPDETVADFTECQWMNDWFDEYESSI